LLLLRGESKVSIRKEQAMVQGTSDRSWQAEARTEETKRLIRDIKRITGRKFTAEEKIRIVRKTSTRGRLGLSGKPGISRSSKTPHPF
jgi:hypothetical protein